jgi:hypothetical protein
MRISSLKIISIGLLFNPVIAFAQLRYDIHLDYGYSNFNERNKETSVQVGNYYTKLPSYSIGCGLYVPFKETKFQLLSGIDFLSLASKNHMPDDFNDPNYTGPKSWEERFYSLSIPLKLGYCFEKWININFGISNTFHVSKPDEMWDKRIINYTIGFSGGIDFLFKKKFILGCNYYRDIIPTAKLLQLPSKTDTYNISYSFELISIKIGYIINKTE